MKRAPYKIVSIASLLTVTMLGITACMPPLTALIPVEHPTSILLNTPVPATASPFTSSPTSTPDPYWKYTIEYLRSRSYGGGAVEVTETNARNSAFTRYLIRYPSDGLMIYGFMNVPNGKGNFPVIIALHGYIDPTIYKTFDYTTHYADALASAGFLVLHPNLRDYPPSDKGDNLFNVGMAIDVLNLISIIKSTGRTARSAAGSRPEPHWVMGAQHGRWGRHPRPHDQQGCKSGCLICRGERRRGQKLRDRLHSGRSMILGAQNALSLQSSSLASHRAIIFQRSQRQSASITAWQIPSCRWNGPCRPVKN